MKAKEQQRKTEHIPPLGPSLDTYLQSPFEIFRQLATLPNCKPTLLVCFQMEIVRRLVTEEEALQK